MAVYRALREHFGHAAWWPGESPLEVAVGAVLTQNTSWKNVERAIATLKRAGLLSLPALEAISESALARHLQSAGTFRVKARRLKNLVAWISRECGGDFEALARRPFAEVRASLLAVNGVGDETADAILLYAASFPTFVVDAYTRRVFARLGFLSSSATYAEAKRLFERALPLDRALFNDYHAQIVRLGQHYCRRNPKCGACPLGPSTMGRVKCFDKNDL
ncbi:MAG: endonuclease III domain-containing protein [Deltaproteobacteria bacterium]|nr:endonuclease III domain-containing protein [Deltaproteobacteria bacterium]